jgi:hypothetical protein
VIVGQRKVLALVERVWLVRMDKENLIRAWRTKYRLYPEGGDDKVLGHTSCANLHANGVAVRITYPNFVSAP